MNKSICRRSLGVVAFAFAVGVLNISLFYFSSSQEDHDHHHTRDDERAKAAAVETTFASWPEPSLTTSAAIVMFDTRKLDVNLNSSYIYHRWAADLNYQYALSHGYDFFYIQSDGVVSYHHNTTNETNLLSVEMDGKESVSKTRTSCYLQFGNVTQPRGAPWCKLLGVAAAMERADAYYSTVVMIDSDAFFKLGAPDIETIIKNTTTATADQLNQPERVLVHLPFDAPRHPRKPNTGLQIWRNTPESWSFLRQWWQTNHSPTTHAYEQSGIDSLLKARGYRLEDCGIGLLHMKMMMKTEWNDPALPAVHLPHQHKLLREAVMRSEWNKIVPKNDDTARNKTVLDRVVIMSAKETFRLQRLLGMNSNNTYC